MLISFGMQCHTTKLKEKSLPGQWLNIKYTPLPQTKFFPILRMFKALRYNWEDLVKQGNLHSEGLTIHLKYTLNTYYK